MAKGDVFDVKPGDEIELSFQLSLKRAEIKKRRDAAKLTHVTIQFAPVGGGGDPPRGTVRFIPLNADVQDPDVFEVLPITEDDPKFTRLYRVGNVEAFAGPPVDLVVRASAHLVPAEGQLVASLVPNDPLLCTFNVRVPKVVR